MQGGLKALFLVALHERALLSNGGQMSDVGENWSVLFAQVKAFYILLKRVNY